MQLADLCQKVIHVELTLGHAFGQPFSFFNLDRFGSLFNKRDNIAHVQNAARQTFRIKRFKRILLFANTGKFNRAAGYMPHRQRRTAARVTVKPGQHNAGNPDRVMKRRGCIDRILTCHRISDQQNFMRVGQLFDLAQLGHQSLINAKTASRIKDQHIIGL